MLQRYLNKTATTFCDKLCWIFFFFSPENGGKAPLEISKGFFRCVKTFFDGSY